MKMNNIRHDQIDSNREMLIHMLIQDALTKNKKIIKSKKPAKWFFPNTQERRYIRLIKAVFAIFTDLINNNVLSNITKWRNENKLLVGDSIKCDEYVDDIENILENEYVEIENNVFENNRQTLLNNLFTIASGVFIFNKVQFKKSLRSSLGVEIDIREPWEDIVIKAWTNRNVSLIKGAVDDYRKKIQEAIINGIETGQTSQSLTQSILKINKNFTKNRANLIARDQINKINGALTRRRQIDVGIKLYEWLTALDERVRGNPNGLYPNAKPKHSVLHGLTMRWDNPNLYSDDGGKTWKKRSSIGGVTLPPGFDINCRCAATPIFSDIINKANRELKRRKL